MTLLFVVVYLYLDQKSQVDIENLKSQAPTGSNIANGIFSAKQMRGLITYLNKTKRIPKSNSKENTLTSDSYWKAISTMIELEKVDTSDGKGIINIGGIRGERY